MLTFEHISKSFPGVKALRDVSFAVPEGNVLGLVGENGAGKSTLMNILGGVHQPDTGSMTMDGSPYAPASPSDALEAGIAFVHQELNLFTNLSIADNLFMDRFPKRWTGIPYRQIIEQSRMLLKQVDLDIDPLMRVEHLSPGERQLIEITKSLRGSVRLIIFDEPATSLTAREKHRLFDLIHRLRGEGRSIIYISHTLDDVLLLADEILVLRDGAVVAQGSATDFTIDTMIAAMVGRDLAHLYPPADHAPRATPRLVVQGLSAPGIIENINLTLRAGEILGLFGLMGSGRTELARILFGLDPAETGTIRLDGTPCQDLSTRERIAQGMAFVTEDRREEGLLMEAPVLDNVGLVSLPLFVRAGIRFIDRGRLRKAVQDVVASVQLKSSSMDRQPVKTLSGGNQQKTVIGKWLMERPDVLIMDEPTRGVDVGARFEVYTLMHNLAAQDVGILCISSEIEELMGICDRILVMRHGDILGSFDRADFNQEEMLRTAFGEEPR